MLCYIENLHLCKNQCSHIFTQYKLQKEHFKLLKFVNLEENGIDNWDEVDEFRRLPNLKRLTLNKNHIQKIVYRQGWPQLYVLSIEDNAIDNFQAFDQLNEFPMIKNIRANGNPIMTTNDHAREIIIARTQFLT